MIYFCLIGWHYNQKEYYQGLKWMNDNNPEMKVFWNCRKEPPDSIKKNFDYEMFPNEGLEWGGYQQLYEKFKFKEEDIIETWDWDTIQTRVPLKEVGSILNNIISNNNPQYDIKIL